MEPIIIVNETWPYEFDKQTSQQMEIDEIKPKNYFKGASKLRWWSSFSSIFVVWCITNWSKTVHKVYYWSFFLRQFVDFTRILWLNLKPKHYKLLYSPELVSCNFSMFRKLKLPCRSTRFDWNEAVKRNLQKELQRGKNLKYTCIHCLFDLL